MTNLLPKDMQQQDKEILQYMVRNVANSNQDFNENSIYQTFNKNKIVFHNFINSS